MATNSSFSSQDSKEVCKEIQDTWGRLSQIGQALACRTRLERRHIRETYKDMYREDLIDRLQIAEAANQRNEICTLLLLWMLEPHERDAVVARDALEGEDTNYKALIEIYAGRKSSQLLLIKQAYQVKFKRHLDQDISSEPSTPYQRILLALATSHKSHHADLSQHIAKCDAKRLYEAGEGRVGAIDESSILTIFYKRSIPQLKLTFSNYKRIYGHDYIKSLKKESSGEFEDSLRTVVKCMYTPVKYYSKMLYASIKGTSANKSALSRVVVSRSEVDMDEIQAAFQNKYGLKLHDALVESIPDGDYKDFLTALATFSTR